MVIEDESIRAQVREITSALNGQPVPPPGPHIWRRRT